MGASSSSPMSLETRVTELESVVTRFMQQQIEAGKQTSSDIRELKSQVGQILAKLDQRESGVLSSDTKNPRIEHLKAITLRSGKEVEAPLPSTRNEVVDSEVQKKDKK